MTEQDRRLFSVCTHEAGHDLVAVNLGLDARVLIANDGNGACVHEEATRFQLSAISFAGTMAEDLCDVRHPDRDLPTVALTSETLSRWVNELTSFQGRRHLSPSDWQGINATELRVEPARLAFEILTARREALIWCAEKTFAEARSRVVGVSHDEAKRLIKAFGEEWSQEQQAAAFAESSKRRDELFADLGPLPERFPAPFEDFLRLVVASGQNDSFNDCFKRFICFLVDKVRSSGWHEANLLHGAGILLDSYAQFETISSWSYSASEYRAWDRSARKNMGYGQN